MDGDARRFGAIVKARRRRRGLTQDGVQDAGGPSVPTQIRIEGGDTGHTPTPATLAKYDTALRWQPGSASNTYYGGDPTDLDEETRAGDDSAAGVDREEFARLMTAHPSIHLAARRMAKLSDNELSTVLDLLTIVEKRWGDSEGG